MPTVGSGRPGPRIGGWIPPYTASEQETLLPQPSVHHLAISASPAETTRIRRRGNRVDAAWILIAVGLSAILAFVTVVVASRPRKDDRLPVAGSMGSLPRVEFPDPALPVPVLPAPAPSPTRTTPVVAERPANHSSATTGRANPPRSRPAIPPARHGNPGWTVGRIVNLAPVKLTGFRVRHRDFRARVDRLSPVSGRLDRADAAFTVRPGLAAATCVSFESVNYPGRYLRHQNFAMFLHKRDGSPLFAADATFCLMQIGPGDARVLRALNFPGRYLVIHRSELFLDAIPPASATSFLAFPPL